MSGRERRRPALLVAAVFLGLQGLAALAFGVLEASEIDSSRLAVGVGVTLIMLGYAVVLAAVARGVALSRRWSRSLAVVTQLLLLLLGWSFRQPPTTVVGLVFAVIASIVLVCLLLPSSTRAFLDEDASA